MSLTMSGLNDLDVDSLNALNININTIPISPITIGFIQNLRSSAQNQIDNINVGGGGTGTGTGPDYTSKFQIIDQEIIDLSNNIFTNKLAIARANTKIVDLSSNLTLSQVDISNNKNNIALLSSKVLDISRNLTTGLVDISNNRYNIGLLNTKIVDLSSNLTLSQVDISNNKNNITLLNTKVLDISRNLTIGLIDISNNRYNIGLLNTKIVDLSLNLNSVHSQLEDTDTRSRNNRTDITAIIETNIPLAITSSIAASVLASGIASTLSITAAITANNIVQTSITTIAIASAVSPLATSIGLIEADIIAINTVLDPLAVTVGELEGTVGTLVGQVEEIQTAVTQLELTVGEHSTDLVLLKTKTHYMITETILTETTSFRGCSFDIYNSDNERTIHIADNSNIFYSYIPFIVQFGTHNIFSIDADAIRFSTLPMYITSEVEIQNTFIQSGAVCILANNTRGFGSNLSIQNFNGEIIQTFKSSTEHNFHDASIIASPNTLASFPNFQPFDNGGILEINADVINLNASVINLGNSRCQVNISGRDFTEYFTQYRRTRNPVAP